MSAAAPADGTGTVSLVAGGPLHRLMLRLGLGDADFGGFGKRMVLLVALLWAPLLVLSLVDGRAWSGARLPFLQDVDTLLRYLVALPMLVFAERILHMRSTVALGKFHERGLVPDARRADFDHIVASTRRWLASPAVEIVLLAFVYLLGIRVIWLQVSALDVDTWYGTVRDGLFLPTLAGHWMQWVSVPLLQFIILRWYYRLLMWAVLMYRLSRLGLRLEPLHPDQAGGLGFLSQLTLAFGPLLVAQGTLAAAWIAGQILYSGATLPSFRVDLAAATILSLAFVLAPLLAFSPALAAAKRAGLSDYGALACRYASEFNHKWRGTNARDGANPLGDADFQSLADLGNAYSTLAGMRVVPFGTRTVIKLAVAFLAPVAPLSLTMLSADELLGRALELLL